MLDAASAAAAECRLVTTGRVTGEPREVTIWFAVAGLRVVLLAGGGCDAHWVRNLVADPAVRVRVRDVEVAGRARIVLGEAEDPEVRKAIAAKYGTTGLKTWLRTSLPVVVDLEPG